jgi:DNA-binding transcriptional ArsR family regulator
LLRVDLSVGDLADTHFAISPLFETVAALRVLRDPGRHAFHLPWVGWARAQLEAESLALPRLWPLLVDTESQPEVLLPAPSTSLPALAEELEGLQELTRPQLRGSVTRVFGEDPPDAARDLLARPRTELRALAGEIAAAFERLLAPHWAPMRALLEADIVHRARALSEVGAAGMFADLHSRLVWRTDHLVLLDPTPSDGPEQTATLGPGGLVLSPSVFIWPELYIKSRTVTRTTVRYPVRGIGLLWDQAAKPTSAGLARLLGRRRAEILQLLQAPRGTGQLAQQLRISDAAASQHLTVLRQAGLITTTELGRNRLHATSELGRQLIAESEQGAG